MDHVDTAPYALVVDDDPFIRMDVLDILSEVGFRTFEAENVEKALIVLKDHWQSIALLFTDVQMPGTQDGFALARETSQCWPDIAIVVASGHIHPQSGDLPEGVHFLGKPFSAALVHRHLQEILPDGQKPKPLKS